MAAMADIGSWVGGLASKVWEPEKGLPFGSYLHSSPPRRQRTLTGPSDTTSSFWQKLHILSGSEQTPQPYLQEQSAFLSVLPLDVRMIVYEMVLGGMLFHIGTEENIKNRMFTHICLRSDQSMEANHQDCFKPTIKRPSSAPRDDYPQATGFLPLLVTCRRIYTEAIDVLYSANTFDFWQNRVAFHFLKVMLPPQRLGSIRRFRWDMQIPHHPNVNSRSRRDWSDLFAFFSREMTGLQNLHIKVNRNYPFEAVVERTMDNEGAAWIQPMVVMAIDANRQRGCKVEIVTNGVVHDPNEIFKLTARDNPTALRMQLLDQTSAELHRRIRVSFAGHG